MIAASILAHGAILFVIIAVWDDMRLGGRLTPSCKTWLLVAAIFTTVSLVIRIIG